jgi:PBP1b-binding outer membrane lipoprotein LpoB
MIRRRFISAIVAGIIIIGGCTGPNDSPNTASPDSTPTGTQQTATDVPAQPTTETDTPSPTPTATETKTSTPTPTPTPTPTETETPTPTETETPTPTETEDDDGGYY